MPSGSVVKVCLNMLLEFGMKELAGKEKLEKLIKEYPQSLKILEDLGMELDTEDQKKSLVEIALTKKIPLQVILNNLSKKLGLSVKWPEIAGVGEHYKDDFSKSTGLRKGKPVGIAKIIAVHSGKGGVGKTTLAILIASFLNREGKKVGILDLDIDCPNVMRALGVEGRHIANEKKKISPIIVDGMKVVSMGAIQERSNQAIMWRGPVMAKAIEQLFFDSDWGEIDVLVVDFPPGTSEAPLTFFNMIKPDGVLIITTPQMTALDDAAKAVDMCKSLQVPIYGIWENMCGEIFGLANQKRTEEITGAKWLGGFDLNKQLAQEKFWQKPLSRDGEELLIALKKIVFSK